MSQTNATLLDMRLIQDKAVRKGCDPLTQTARGRLQTQRQKLNEKINKEFRMRAGAENLYRAAESNKKLRDRVGIELSYFNSNIQLLKEQLSDMNSRLEVYQHGNAGSTTPMIPLGMKETTALDFSTALQDNILEHYSEDGEKYKKEIQELNDLREAVRTPERSHAGVELLMEYFNQLNYLEKRFFSTKRHLPLHFHWYDCLTGVPDTQKSVGFEKGCILYNIGALYTQIACRQDRTTRDGVVQSIVNFEKAAGAFRYLENRFSSAPSQDMQGQTLSMLVSLMLAQAQECVLEGWLLTGSKEGVSNCCRVAQEATMVSEKYEDTHRKMSQEPTKSYLPFSWLSMAESKHHFYKGLAHFYVARALLDQKDSHDVVRLRDIFERVLSETTATRDENNGLQLPQTEEERRVIGKAHLRESVVNHEESLRIHNLCKQLRRIDTFREILQKTHERALNRFSTLEEEDDFSELLIASSVVPHSEHDSAAVVPDLSQVKVVDIFWRLGPINVFNATNDWSAPRCVVLERKPSEGFGFSVKGDSLVVIADIEPDSVASRCAMKVKDYIVGIGNVDTKWAKHEEVVNLVRQANLRLKLLLITPTPKHEPIQHRPFSTVNLPTSPVKLESQPQSATERDKRTTNRISAPWLFVRKTSGKEKNGLPSRPPSMLSPPSPLVNGGGKHLSNGHITAGHHNHGADVEL